MEKERKEQMCVAGANASRLSSLTPLVSLQSLSSFSSPFFAALNI